MYQRIHRDKNYPEVVKDHPDVAMSLSNMGLVLGKSGQTDEALSYDQEALDIYQRIHSDKDHPGVVKDHPDVANALNNVGARLNKLGYPKKALKMFFMPALKMYQRIHRDKDHPGVLKDHPDVARLLNNVGVALDKSGKPNEALSYTNEALQMRERIKARSRQPKHLTKL